MKLKELAEKHNLDITELACALGFALGKELEPDDEVEVTPEVVASVKDFMGVDISESVSSESGEDQGKEEGSQGEKEEQKEGDKGEEGPEAETKKGKEGVKEGEREEKEEERMDKAEAVVPASESKEGKEGKEGKEEGDVSEIEKKDESERGEVEEVKDREEEAEGEEVGEEDSEIDGSLKSGEGQEVSEEAEKASETEGEKTEPPEEEDTEKADAVETEIEDGEEQDSLHREADTAQIQGEEDKAVQGEIPGGEGVPEGMGDERAALLGEAAPPESSLTEKEAASEEEQETVPIEEQSIKVDAKEEVVDPTVDIEVPESEPVLVETIETPESSGSGKAEKSGKKKDLTLILAYIVLGIAIVSLLLMLVGVFRAGASRQVQNTQETGPVYTDSDLFAIMYRMLEKGNYAAVEDLFEELKEDFPDSKFLDDAALYMAETFYSKRIDLPDDRRYQKAFEYYRYVYENSPKILNKEKALLYMSHSLFKQGKYKSAVSYYKEFLKEFDFSKHKSEAQFYVGYSLYLEGDLEGAIKAFAEATKELRDDRFVEKAYYYRIKALFEMNRFKEVASLAPKFIDIYGHSDRLSEVLFMYADALIKMQEIDGAIKAYSDAEHKLPKDLLAALLFRKAKAYELKGDRESALKTYLELAKKFKYHKLSAQAMYRAAQLYVEMGDNKDAVELLYRLKERFYNWKRLPDGIYLLAIALAREGRFSEAERWLRHIIEKFDDYSDLVVVKWRLARILELERKYDAAVAQYSELLKALPSSDKANRLRVAVSRANALLKGKKYKEAIGAYVSLMTEFSKSKELDKGKIMYMLSLAYFYDGDYAKAIGSFKDAITNSPLSAWRFRCRYMLGRTYEEIGEIQSAIDQYQRIVNNRFLLDRTTKSLAWIGLGRIYMKTQRYKEAFDAFANARALTTDWWRSTELLKRQADALLEEKQFGSAIKLYAKYMDRIMRYYKARVKKKGKGYYVLDVRRNPEEGFDKILEAMTKIGDTHYRMGAYEVAIKVYKKIESICRNAKRPLPDWVVFQIGMCYKSMGLMDKANLYFSKVITDYPDSIWAREAEWQRNEMQVMEKLNRAENLLQEVTE